MANLLSSKNASLEELYTLAQKLHENTRGVFIHSSKLVPVGDTVTVNNDVNWEEAFNFVGEADLQNVSASNFGLHQLLGVIKMPPTFYDRIPGDLRKTCVSRLLPEHKNYLTATVVNQEGQPVIIGLRTTKGMPMKSLDILEYLSEWLTTNNFEYSLHHTYMDMHHMSFKIVLENTEDVFDENDSYKYGIAIQNSEVKYCNTVITPMLFRPVCSNGLTLVKNEKSLVSGSVTMPKEALKIVFDDVLEWIEKSSFKDVLDVLRQLKQNAVRWNVKRIKALLPTVLSGVSGDASNAFKKSLFEVYPERDDKFAADAYSFLQFCTNKAQEFSAHIQTQIESNVYLILSQIASETARAKAAAVEVQVNPVEVV